MILIVVSFLFGFVVFSTEKVIVVIIIDIGVGLVFEGTFLTWHTMTAL